MHACLASSLIIYQYKYTDTCTQYSICHLLTVYNTAGGHQIELPLLHVRALHTRCEYKYTDTCTQYSIIIYMHEYHCHLLTVYNTAGGHQIELSLLHVHACTYTCKLLKVRNGICLPPQTLYCANSQRLACLHQLGDGFI